VADLRPLALLVEAAVIERVVVVGSPPHDARDLDVLAHPGAMRQLEETLAAAGFDQRGHTWARFGSGRAEVVDLLPAAGCGLPAPAVDALFDQAVPLPGFRYVCLPAAHHVLLLLAWRLGPTPGRLSVRRAARVDAAIAADPAAWAAAAGEASVWAAGEGLAALRSVHAGHGSSPVRPPRPLRARARLARRRRGRLVALSGLDGAGKSTLARALAEALGVLGYDARVEWTRITYNPSLDVIARPVKRALAAVTRARPSPGGASVSSTAAYPPPVGGSVPGLAVGSSPAMELRRRSRLVDRVWVTIVALANAWSLGPGTRRHLRRGQMVIRDRYVLDSTVGLFDRYGSSHRWPARLIGWLTPRPACAFYLDVRAETALARKPEEWDLAALARHRASYLEWAPVLGASVIDADRPWAEVFAEVATLVWRACP